MQNYIFIQTYGCTANQNNSEILKGILMQSGYQITNNIDIADIIILNTCVVKQKTENKIKRKIQDIKKQHPNKLLITTGCMPETDKKQIKKLNPNTILLGTHHFKEILNLIKSYNANQLTSNKQQNFLDYKKEEKLNLPKFPNNKLISICQISEGCLGNCSFCKTRIAKGKLFSYPEDKIIKSIENDLKQGAKEIWITSQDCANYGLDKDKKIPKLPQLLNKILNLKHNFKLRLGMMDPNNVIPILNQLVEIYKNKKMYKFIHIPIQSASDKVLKHMNRFYTIKQAEKIIKEFKKEIPNITIATDIIVGYPTEIKKDHQANLDFIKKFKPDVLNLSKISIHKGTRIYNQLEQEKSRVKGIREIEITIIKKRTSELMKLHRKTASENKKKFLNKKIKIFVNQKLENNLYECRDENYNIILINSKQKILGKNIKVNINQTGVHHMLGEVI